MQSLRKLIFPRTFISNQSKLVAVPNQVRLNSTNLSPVIRVTRRDAIKIITLDRPAQKNAMNDQMWKGLAKEINGGDADDSVNLIVVEGNEDSFCSGTDLKEVRERVEEAQNTGIVNSDNLMNLAGALIECRKPLVALVQGMAVGIGVTPLALCDFVFASDKATFWTPFTRLGIVPECCSSYTFPKIMGYSRAASLLYFNEKISADQAYQWGLVSRVIDNKNFHDETTRILKELAALPPKSLQLSKELVRQPERELLHKVARREADVIERCLKGQEVPKALQTLLKPKNK